jgi:hypothetical protein
MLPFRRSFDLTRLGFTALSHHLKLSKLVKPVMAAEESFVRSATAAIPDGVG